MITPANFMTNNYLAKLRRLLVEKGTLDHILVIDGGVFRGVSVDNAIIVLTAGGSTETTSVIHASASGQQLAITSTSSSRPLNSAELLFTGSDDKKLQKVMGHLRELSIPLGSLAYVNFGKQLRDRSLHPKDVITVASKKAVPRNYRPCYTGKDVMRYATVWGNLACLNDRVAQSGGCWDDEKQELSGRY